MSGSNDEHIQEPKSDETEEGIISNDSEDQNEMIEHCLKHELIEENFDIKKKIGSGGYGFVYKVVNKCDNTKYALKFVPADNFDDTKREVKALATLRHDNIIRYCSSWKIQVPAGTSSNETKSSESESTFCSEMEVEESDVSEEESLSIVFEDNSKRSPCGVCLVIQTELYVRNLQMLIEDELFSMSDDQRHSIVFDIVHGLEYIHNKGYLHRDLKPSNIFLDEFNRAKIGDFGSTMTITDNEVNKDSSMSVKRSLTKGVGTKNYIAPEVEISTEYNESADLYSLGIILFEMYCKMGSQMERNKTLEMVRNKTTRIETLWKISTEHYLIRIAVFYLLERDPRSRLNLKQVERGLNLQVPYETLYQGFCLLKSDPRSRFDLKHLKVPYETFCQDWSRLLKPSEKSIEDLPHHTNGRHELLRFLVIFFICMITQLLWRFYFRCSNVSGNSNLLKCVFTR